MAGLPNKMVKSVAKIKYMSYHHDLSLFIKSSTESLLKTTCPVKLTEHNHHNSSTNHSVSVHDCFHKQPFPAKPRGQRPLVESQEKTSKLLHWGVENDKQPQSKRRESGIASLTIAHGMITATSESM